MKRILGILLVALVVCVSNANADFMVYLSDKAPTESPVPGPLNAVVAPGHTGNLYLYGDGDTQLSGLSLDLAVGGSGIKLTSALVNNPSGRWSFLDGPLTIANNLITNIGGAAIPPGAPGVGGPVPDEVPAPVGGYLLATIGYEALLEAGAGSDLQFRIGSNLVADYEGNAAMVRLGGPNASAIDGTVAGSSGLAGTISVVPEPSALGLVGLAVVAFAGLIRRRK